MNGFDDVSLTYRVVDWLAEISRRFNGRSETPALDAQTLLVHVSGKSRAWVLAHPEVVLPSEVETAMTQALHRLEAGEPLPYIIGHWEFYGLDFLVTEAVLIPRPETELLVEQALAWLRAVRNQASAPIPFRAVDVGTGSGCIAIALARHAPGLPIVAIDLSMPALQVAQRNARRHDLLNRIAFVQGDLLSPLSPSAGRQPGFNLICANLPYIPEAELKFLTVANREPHLALSGGGDGLVVIRRLLEMAPAYLAQKGLLLLEIEASSGPATLGLARQAFPDARIQLLNDLAGRHRFIWIEK